MLLEQVKNISDTDEELAKEMDLLTEQFLELVDRLEEDMNQFAQGRTGAPEPGTTDQGVGTEPDDIIAALDQAIKQMDAAKRGMGILNKMGDSSFRTKNKSRVLGNMNKIRGSLQRVDKMLAQAAEVNADDTTAAKSDMGDINKMPDSPERTRSRSRLMGGLNRLRGAGNRMKNAQRN